MSAVATSAAAGERALEARLCDIVESSPWFRRLLAAGQASGLASWCIGAGALRNLVWDRLHGHATASCLSDIDFAYFDADDLSPESEQTVQARLLHSCPGQPWEATNQAAVHLWFERCFGHRVEALPSLEAAVATWPEFATSVAVSRNADGDLRVIAPHGLDDLFGMVVRRNPIRVSAETFARRVRDKNYPARWPKVRIDAA